MSSIEAYLASIATPTTRGTANFSLSYKINLDGKIAPRHEHVEARVKAGWVVKTVYGVRFLVSPEETAITDKELGKLGLDYAEYLIASAAKQ